MKTLLCTVFLTAALAAQTGRAPDLLPTLREVFADIGTLLASADAGRVEAINARLAECGDELRLLETLAGALTRGILVDLPQALREKSVVPATEATIADETRLLEELRAELKIAEARRMHQGLPDGLSRARSGTALAKAAASISLEIPVPPASMSGTLAAVVQSSDPLALGRALYMSKDWAGAMNAFNLVPTEKRSPEASCLMARCLERLERWSEAQALYEKTSAAEPTGPWGDLARWMLRFGGQKSSVRSVLGAVPAAPRGLK
ncbi:MAG: hypothetical protein EXS14_09380 [Planctomycetes bacterium]|nr:hypothetical protein [Planctomycetota bacterium]